MKKSITLLSETLKNEGYPTMHSQNFLQVIKDLLEKGHANIRGRDIFAAGISPIFKLNNKSVDVYLETTSELNTLRIHHPNNGWWTKFQGWKVATCLSNKKWMATRLGDSTKIQRVIWNQKTFLF